jgi:TRAP-type C4-dicarboxylate transport system permease small subunit
MWALMADVFIIIVNIVMRRFFNSPIFGVTELIQYTMLFSASFAIVENEWVDGNVNMHMLLEKMTQRTRSFVLFIVNILTTFGMGVVDYLLFKQFLQRFAEGKVTHELGFPVWAPALVIAIGFGLLAVVLAGKTILWYWMWKSNNFISFRALGSLREERKELDAADLIK